MSQRNSFFASIFTRELDRWKKENHKSQEDFAEAIGKHPNMITKYKGGKDFPTDETMEEICRVLQVDEVIFYPQTFEEKLRYDSVFKAKVKRALDEMEMDEISAMDINILFWEFLWREMPYLKRLMPSSVKRKKKDFLFQKEINGEVEFYDKEDLEFVSSLQKDVTSYIHQKVIQYALGQYLDMASDDAMASGSPPDEKIIQRQLESIYDMITLDLLQKKEDSNGID